MTSYFSQNASPPGTKKKWNFKIKKKDRSTLKNIKLQVRYETLMYLSPFFLRFFRFRGGAFLQKTLVDNLERGRLPKKEGNTTKRNSLKAKVHPTKRRRKKCPSNL